jgi:HSP20 family protein
VSQTETGYTISVAAPGVSKEDINVNIEANTLTISYTEEETTETSFACSSFRRSWRLPEGTDVENITATYYNGILSLSVPTADAATYTRTIEVE